MGFIPDPKTTKLYLQIRHFTFPHEVVISRPLTQATAYHHSVVFTCICYRLDQWTKLGKLQRESLSCTKYVASQLLHYYHVTSKPTVTCASLFPFLFSVTRNLQEVPQNTVHTECHCGCIWFSDFFFSLISNQSTR